MKKPVKTLAPTEAQFKAFQSIYDYFNERLFENSLPAVLLNLSRKNKAMGFFAPNRWKDVKVEEVEGQDTKMMHEISLNPDHLAQGFKEACDTLVHEMCHLQRQIAPGKKCVNHGHDKQWASMMKAVGLQPFNVKDPEKETGPSCSDRPIPGGAFEVCFEEMPEEFQLPFSHIAVESKNKAVKKASKTKYTCPDCETNAWAKPETKLVCGECMIKMLAEGEVAEEEGANEEEETEEED
jgi:predicted SprT family Zn-dependent metalloprotease